MRCTLWSLFVFAALPEVAALLRPRRGVSALCKAGDAAPSRALDGSGLCWRARSCSDGQGFSSDGQAPTASDACLSNACLINKRNNLAVRSTVLVM